MHDHDDRTCHGWCVSCLFRSRPTVLPPHRDLQRPPNVRRPLFLGSYAFAPARCSLRIVDDRMVQFLRSNSRHYEYQVSFCTSRLHGLDIRCPWCGVTLTHNIQLCLCYFYFHSMYFWYRICARCQHNHRHLRRRPCNSRYLLTTNTSCPILFVSTDIDACAIPQVSSTLSGSALSKTSTILLYGGMPWGL